MPPTPAPTPAPPTSLTHVSNYDVTDPTEATTFASIYDVTVASTYDVTDAIVTSADANAYDITYATDASTYGVTDATKTNTADVADVTDTSTYDVTDATDASTDASTYDITDATGANTYVATDATYVSCQRPCQPKYVFRPHPHQYTIYLTNSLQSLAPWVRCPLLASSPPSRRGPPVRMACPAPVLGCQVPPPSLCGTTAPPPSPTGDVSRLASPKGFSQLLLHNLVILTTCIYVLAFGDPNVFERPPTTSVGFNLGRLSLARPSRGMTAV